MSEDYLHRTSIHRPAYQITTDNGIKCHTDSGCDGLLIEFCTLPKFQHFSRALKPFCQVIILLIILTACKKTEKTINYESVATQYVHAWELHCIKKIFFSIMQIYTMYMCTYVYGTPWAPNPNVPFYLVASSQQQPRLFVSALLNMSRAKDFPGQQGFISRTFKDLCDFPGS
jgi:hypothetical protein